MDWIKNQKVIKDQQPSGPIKFNGEDYYGIGYITTGGDTIKAFTAQTAKPGNLYEIKYTSKKGENGKKRLTTRQETGQLKAGDEVRINLTSPWGETINNVFEPAVDNLQITDDYSQKPWYSKWLYRMVGLKSGGHLMRINGKLINMPK